MRSLIADWEPIGMGRGGGGAALQIGLEPLLCSLEAMSVTLQPLSLGRSKLELFLVNGALVQVPLQSWKPTRRSCSIEPSTGLMEWMGCPLA